MTDLTHEEMDQMNRDAWNAAHAIHHPGALSGSDPAEVLHHHRLEDLKWPGLTALDIGVGLGGMSRCLRERGCTVDALDVSDVAEETVRQFIRKFYVAERIEDLPGDEYDLALSQLVAQHMCERNLRCQIRRVFRSLKLGGVFSLHLAGSADRGMSNLPGPIPPGMDGAMCRDPDYATAMIHDELQSEQHEVRLLDHRMEWPQFGTYWYFVHIVKPRQS